MAEETLRKTWLKDDNGEKIAPITLSSSVYNSNGLNIDEIMITQDISGSSYNYDQVKTNADQLVKAQTAEPATSDYINSKNIVKYGDLVADTEGADTHYDPQVLTLEEISAVTDVVSLYGKLPTASSVYNLNKYLGLPSAASSVTGDDAFTKISNLNQNLQNKGTDLYHTYQCSDVSIDTSWGGIYYTYVYVPINLTSYDNIQVTYYATSGNAFASISSVTSTTLSVMLIRGNPSESNGYIYIHAHKN